MFVTEEINDTHRVTLPLINDCYTDVPTAFVLYPHEPRYNLALTLRAETLVIDELHRAGIAVEEITLANSQHVLAATFADGCRELSRQLTSYTLDCEVSEDFTLARGVSVQRESLARHIGRIADLCIMSRCVSLSQQEFDRKKLLSEITLDTTSPFATSTQLYTLANSGALGVKLDYYAREPLHWVQ